MKATIADKMMQEKINYGGLVLTRFDVLKWMQEENIEPRCIDYMVFGTPKLPDDTPLTPKIVLEAFKTHLTTIEGEQ